MGVGAQRPFGITLELQGIERVPYMVRELIAVVLFALSAASLAKAFGIESPVDAFERAVIEKPRVEASEPSYGCKGPDVERGRVLAPLPVTAKKFEFKRGGTVGPDASDNYALQLIRRGRP